MSLVGSERCRGGHLAGGTRRRGVTGDRRCARCDPIAGAVSGSLTLIFGLGGPTGRMFGMVSDQPHSGGEIAGVDATVYVDTELHPRSGKGNVLQSDRQEPIGNHWAQTHLTVRDIGVESKQAAKDHTRGCSSPGLR